jgi:hypothetical protein
MSNTKLKGQLNGKLQSQQIEPAGAEVVNVPSTPEILAPIESNYIALTNNALDIINENLQNQPLSYQLFDIVKSPSGGTVAFTVPGVSGDDVEKELTGIILGYTMPRAYWETPEPIEGTPPVCYSRDSQVSFDGKPCNTCSFNDFGSKDGESNGKACKESVHIFLLRQDNILPLIVRVPVSSKMMFLKYTTRLVSSLTPISGVVTKISLEKAASKKGQPYAKFIFEMVNTLTPEETANARAFGQKFMDAVNAVPEQDLQEAV